MINRFLSKTIKDRLFRGRILILTGSRHCGKTTLIMQLLRGEQDVLTEDCSLPSAMERIQRLASNNPSRSHYVPRILFLDNLHTVEDPAPLLSALNKTYPETQLIAATEPSSYDSGSNSLDQLRGKKLDYTLFPLTWREFVSDAGIMAARSKMGERIVHGMYPEVVISSSDRQIELLTERVRDEILSELTSNEPVRKPQAMEKLLTLLALHTGSEVTLNRLSNWIGVDKNTVGSYLQLIEKHQLIFKLLPYSTGHPAEIKNAFIYYFYDTGIRNALLSSWQPPELRTDRDTLLKNFLISERMKRLYEERKPVKVHYWRNRTGRIVDYIEVRNESVKAWNIRWNRNSRVHTPKPFRDQYGVTAQILHSGNFGSFLEFVG